MYPAYRGLLLCRFFLALRRMLSLPTPFLCPGKHHNIGPQNHGCGLIYSIPLLVPLVVPEHWLYGDWGRSSACSGVCQILLDASSQVKKRKVGFKSLSKRGFLMFLTSQMAWRMFPLFVQWPRKRTVEMQAKPMTYYSWLIWWCSWCTWYYLFIFIIHMPHENIVLPYSALDAI